MTFSSTTAVAAGTIAALLATSGCIEIAGADLGKYVEREEKHFVVEGKPDISLSTFNGSIEIRPWDKPEVNIVIEKRGYDKQAIDRIEVNAEASGNRVDIRVTAPKTGGGFGFHMGDSRSAKLIVSVPASADLKASSGDGSIDIEHVAGKLELRSGDGSIHGTGLDGAVTAHTGDGSIKLDGVTGSLNVDTGDGSITVAGALTEVRARSGDGRVTIRAGSGSAAKSDWDINTGDGSVTLTLPDGFGGELDARSGDGNVHMNDVTLSNVTGEIGRRSVTGTLGSGGAKVRIRTGDGSITLKRS
jgi:DUF4097 and DUF4098 domain-containing protein YvlB